MIGWWQRRALVAFITSPLDHAPAVPPPPPPASPYGLWADPAYRIWQARYQMMCTYFGGDAFPIYEAHMGPGNLAAFLGSHPEFSPDTVWFEPCLPEPPDAASPLRFDAGNEWVLRQDDIIRAGLDIPERDFMIGMPDLIENIDTYSSLRGTHSMLLDLVDRPEFVLEKLQEINAAWLEAFDHFYQQIKDADGGNAWTYFNIYGPGKTAKVQCDASAMISPRMFKKFVAPMLQQQCEWMDYSMYHLDGTACMPHLPQLLAIDALTAIEWTPEPSVPRPGSPEWYGLYRKILNAGKSVHAWYVPPENVIPLLDAVGGAGVLMIIHAESETQARQLEEAIEPYR